MKSDMRAQLARHVAAVAVLSAGAGVDDFEVRRRVEDQLRHVEGADAYFVRDAIAAVRTLDEPAHPRPRRRFGRVFGKAAPLPRNGERVLAEARAIAILERLAADLEGARPR